MASTKDIGLGAPIWGCPFTLRFPVGTDAGDLETGLAAAADSEVSLDGGSFADCANEITEIGTTGWYSITLEAAEMQASSVAYKMLSGSYGYHVTLCPVRCGTVATGTAAAGGAATLTLAAGSVIVDDEYVGYILRLTGGTGSGQAARIIDAVASTRVLTVQADWLTQPDETTTYAILIPPERAMLLSTVAGDVEGLDGEAMRGTDGAYTGTPPTVEQIQSGLATAASVEAVDTIVDGIAAKTINLPANPAAVGSEMTLAEGSVVATLSEETYAEIAAALLGDGAHSVELFVKDDDTVYSNVLVFMVDGIRGLTDSQGSVEFNLDDGTYTFYIRSSSLFTAESSYSVVIADGVITSPVGGILEVESAIIPSVVTPNSVIVYSDEYNPNGVSLVGAGERNVYVVSMETNRYSPEYLSHFQPLGDKDTAITTDANGRWYTEFPAESTIIIRIYDTVSGKSEGWKFTTPSSGSCSLWQLSPVPVYLTQR
jgi:hypothetical protein